MWFIYNLSPSGSPGFSTSHTPSQVLFSVHIYCVFRNLYTRSRPIANGFLLYTMQLTTLVLAAGLTFAAAQTTTSAFTSTSTLTSASTFDLTSTSPAPIGTTSACAAQPYVPNIPNYLPPRPKSSALTFLSRVLDACIATEQAQINGCSPSDYSCLCQQYGNLLTCYNNCPNDPGLFGIQQEKTQQ